MFTPARLQEKQRLAARRAVMLALCFATVAALTGGVWHVFAPGGFTVADWVIITCFAVGVPWTVMGVWNAFLGLWLLHWRREGVLEAAPHLAAAAGAGPLTSRTALVMFLRNEPPESSFARLLAMRESLDATGHGGAFDFHILSDTSDAGVAEEETQLFLAHRAMLGGTRAHYRRRSDNTGYKAGNLREFVAHARGYDFFVPLDSDSLMSGEQIVRMVRIGEAHPRIGILQSLVVGTPSRSLFARIFQFGMRHGMRSYTLGAAWWQGDCGPYWGHNALIRMGAFRRHCRLPLVPGRPPLGGHILSHDQVEAVLMRRAGYEVRVIPTEGESWEENPPTLADFTKRDLRWCQGNMQYWGLLGLKGLRPVSLFQMFAAIMMYTAAPAWMVMTVAAAMKVFEADAGMDLALGLAMFFTMFAVSLVPKLVGLLDIALTTGGAARYGGRLRFAVGGLVEAVFSVLTAPVVAFRVSMFLVGLLFGQTVTWNGQNRDPRVLEWADALRGLWPQTLFGLTLAGVILFFAGAGTLVWAAPMVAGLVLSAPLAVATASPRLGRLAERIGLCAVPEEITRAPLLARVEVLSAAISAKAVASDRIAAE